MKPMKSTIDCSNVKGAVRSITVADSVKAKQALGHIRQIQDATKQLVALLNNKGWCEDTSNAVERILEIQKLSTCSLPLILDLPAKPRLDIVED